jgi:predicted PurR-regulated permease PerM
MLAERILMGLLLGGVGVGCFLVLAPFLSSILWAAILVFATWPMHEWLRARLHWRRGFIAGLMVSLTAVIVVLPMALAAPDGANEVNNLRQLVQDALARGLPKAPGWLNDVPAVGSMLTSFWNRSAEDLAVLGESLRPYFGILAEGGFSLLLGIAQGVLLFLLSLFIAFFFYLYAEPIAARLDALLHRIAGNRADRLIAVTGATVRGTVYGILGTAVVQGLLTAFGLWVSGVPRAVLLGAVAGFLSVLPIGSPVVWIPSALWLLATDHIGWGIFLAVYGAFIISGSDNVIRPWFISRGAQLPYLLTVLGVLGGAIAFGLLGIFVGPVLLAVGYTLVTEWPLPKHRGEQG